jgi:hypothetical protein
MKRMGGLSEPAGRSLLAQRKAAPAADPPAAAPAPAHPDYAKLLAAEVHCNPRRSSYSATVYP